MVNHHTGYQLGDTVNFEHPQPATHQGWAIPEGFKSVKSAKIWFIGTVAETGLHMLSYSRRPRFSDDRESYDTFGGTRDPGDKSIAACLLRELHEEISEMSREWRSCVREATTVYPEGHNTYTSVKWSQQEIHHTTVWFVHLPSNVYSPYILPTMSPQFYMNEGVEGTLKWRPINDIGTNLSQFGSFHQSLLLIIHRASCRWETDRSNAERPKGRTVDPTVAQQRRGIVEICAGLGMMTSSCVRNGFAHVVATCDTQTLCCELQKQKHPEATHYLGDVTKLKDSIWSKYRYDPLRPMETAYLLVSGPPCTPYSTAGRARDLEDQRADVMQYLVHLAKIMQPRLVVIENVEGFLEKDSWDLLQNSFKVIDYSLVHIEIMIHSQLGGATSRRRVFIWFQLNMPGIKLYRPRIEQRSPFEEPQMVIRDILDPSGHSTNPIPLKTSLKRYERVNCTVGQPVVIGRARWGDLTSCPIIQPGIRGNICKENGTWSVLELANEAGLATFINCDRKQRKQKVEHPLEDFTRQDAGQDHKVHSIDGIAPTIRAQGEFPERTGCLIWQPDEIRRLSVEEIWRIQQLDPNDLEKLKALTFGRDPRKVEDALLLVAGNSIVGPMAHLMAQLTQQMILQIDERGPQPSGVVTESSVSKTSGSRELSTLGSTVEQTTVISNTLTADMAATDAISIESDDSGEDTYSMTINQQDDLGGAFSGMNIESHVSQHSHLELGEGYQGYCTPSSHVERPSIGKHGERDIVSSVARLVSQLSAAEPTGPIVTETTQSIEEKGVRTVECTMQASQQKLYNVYDEQGVLRNQCEENTVINADIRVVHTSERRITFRPRVCYLQGGAMIDLSQMKVAFETMVSLSRQCSDAKDSVPVSAADLAYKKGICDDPGDPFYDPQPSHPPECVQEAIDEFIQFCSTAISEGDLDRVWVPPKNPDIAIYMSVVLTTPMYTWAIGPDGKRHRVLMDSGSAISLVSDITTLRTSQNFKLDESGNPISVRGVDPGSTLRSRGMVSFPLKFPVQEFIGARLFSEEDSRNAYTIQRGPMQGPQKGEEFPVDDTRTHVHLEYIGYHFDSAGCGILIGMDLLARESPKSQGGTWATPTGFDFRNGRVLFRTHKSPMHSDSNPVDFGTASVPTYYHTPSNEGVESSRPVLVVNVHGTSIPPGHTAQIRCTGQCGYMPKDSMCTVVPHPNLLPTTSSKKEGTPMSIGPEQYVLSRFVPDPRLLWTEAVHRYKREGIKDEKSLPPHMGSSQRYRKSREDDRLRDLHKVLQKEIRDNTSQDCGLVVEFSNPGTLIYWSQLDNSMKGQADRDFHVMVSNTSPVEMVLLAGQPIAEATTATYWDPQRNIATIIKQPNIEKGVAKSLKCVGDTSTVDVDALTLLLTQKPRSHHPMQLQLNAQVPHSGNDLPEWPRLIDVKHALTEPDAVIKVETVCAMVKIQRGIITEFLMELIHCTPNHRIDDLGDELDEEVYGKSRSSKWKEVSDRFSALRPENPGELGRLRFVLGIHKLLYRFPGLTVAVLADMMSRPDTGDHLRKMLCSCADPPVVNQISKETQQCNFENLLIIERWTENTKRAIRATPIEDTTLLEGFEFPLYNGTGKRIPYTSKVQTDMGQECRTYTTKRLVEALSVIVEDSRSRRDRLMASPQVNMVQSTNNECKPVKSAGYACLSLQTLVVSAQDNQLQDLMTINRPFSQKIHLICKAEIIKNQASAAQQYGRDQDGIVDQVERARVGNQIKREGLVGVQPTFNGIDRIEGSEAELEESLEKQYRHHSTSHRNIEAENAQEEANDPALGGDPSGVDQGYHFDVQLTSEELATQLLVEQERLKSKPWYNQINRPVTTTDKDEEGNLITMPWYKWTYTQAWRKLRELEPEETLHGEDDCNLLYTLRSVLDVGLPDDDELEKMGLVAEDRVCMVESVWRMAPCFYQGPNLPQIRHFSFTRMFMSLVTTVPYRQKPLVIPVHAEELVYTSIRAMIKDGVVEASLSPYNNGLLLVAKKPSRPGAPPSGMRVVLDARGLNHITRRVNWPIEDLSLCLREVAGAAFITVTDVLSGFHLIPLDPECRPPTAFTCGSLGHLQYCRAGMGMANSPARFASVLSGVLGVLRHNVCGQGHDREGNNYAPYPHSGVCSSEEMLKNTEIGVTEERTKEFKERAHLWKVCQEADQMDRYVEDTFTLHRCLCIVYVDDVTVATWYDRSEGKQNHQMERLQLIQHLRDAESALMRMRQFGIVCKAGKTEVARPCNELLGYIVGRDGLRANSKKVDKLMDLDLPRSKEGLNFFIGLAGFYRQFIPRLAVLEAPLRRLLNDPRLPSTVKDVNDHTIPAIWDELSGEETATPMESFKAIIMELAKFTALSSIDYRPQAGRVGIAADASRYGLAAVLFQETVCGTDKDGRELYRERPICYWSKALVDKSQSAYPYDRELAAITLAVRNWHKYILGRRILIVSDHQPLDYMMEPKKNSQSEKKQSSRLLWLIMELARYDVSVCWRAGKWIPHADAISRILKVGRIISTTIKPVMESEPHIYDPDSCDRISLVCGEVPYTREDQAASMIDGDEAERVWLADTSDTEAAIQSVAANPDLWHGAKTAILTDLKKFDHQFTGKTDDELYLEYIDMAKGRIESATRCRAGGQGTCTKDEWASYLEIAGAIGIDPSQRSDTLTPFRHIAIGGVSRGDTQQRGWIQIAQGKEWSLSDKIPCSSANTDVMQCDPTNDEKFDTMEEEDTRTMKVLNCHITTDHRHKGTRNLDPVYRRILESITCEEPMMEPTSSFMLDIPKDLHSFDKEGWQKEKSAGTNSLIARAQLFEDRLSRNRQESPNCATGGIGSCVDTEEVDPPRKREVEYTTGVMMAQQLNQQADTILPMDKEDRCISQMIENHINMVRNQEEGDEEPPGEETEPFKSVETEQKEPVEIDAEINFSKTDATDMQELWKKDNLRHATQYKSAERPISIMWHNVNGIGSFIKHLKEEGTSYFQPEELHPDIFGILEAKVSQAHAESVALITVLKDLVESLTGCKYVEIRSIRRSTSRCGTIVFLKTSFLETREWWTWHSDLEVYDPTYLNLQSAGYICRGRELGTCNEWNRRTVGDGDGRVIQIILGPDKRANSSSPDEAALRIFVVYTRNSSSGLGDPTARIHFDEQLHNAIFSLHKLPTIAVGDLNVCVTDDDVMSRTSYKKDHNTIVGCLPHERQAAKQFIDSGMTSNNILDREAGVTIGHTAGGMGETDGTRHWLQLFNLDRALFQFIKYVSTAYWSLSIMGKELTQKFIDQTRRQSQLTKALTGSDHTKQHIIIEEEELREDRLEAALSLDFDRPDRRRSAPHKLTREEYSVVMSLIMAREMWDEVAYAMSFPYDSEEAQIVWAGIGYRHQKNQPYRCNRVVNFRYRKATLSHRWMGIAPWYKPLPVWWTKKPGKMPGGEHQVKSSRLIPSLNDYLHRLVYDLYILHKKGYVERGSRKELQKIQTLRTSTHPLAESYVSSYTQLYGVLSISSKLEPNTAPGTNPWRMGSMIFQQKNSAAQRIVTSIALPNTILIPDHYTNERYTQIIENTMAGRQPGNFGLTRSKDARVYQFGSATGPVERGLRRSPGEGGGRSGLHYMAYAKYMYLASEMVTVSRGGQAEDPFQTYARLLIEIVQSANELAVRCATQRPHTELWSDAISTCALISAMENAVRMYLFRTGSWVEYNTIFGNRLAELGRSNQCIPPTRKLIEKVDMCIKHIRPVYNCLDQLMLFYGKELMNTPSKDRSAEAGAESNRVSAWDATYTWRRMCRMYLLFQPEYTGENAKRHNRAALSKSRQVTVDEWLGRSLRWEGSEEQCKLRLSDNQIPVRDPHGDASGILRTTIRTMVEDRSKMFTKEVRANTQREDSRALVHRRVRQRWLAFKHKMLNKERIRMETMPADEKGSTKTEEKKYQTGPSYKSSPFKLSKEETQTLRILGRDEDQSPTIQSDLWMITWTRLSTSVPFPDVNAYIRMDTDSVRWSEEGEGDQKKTYRTVRETRDAWNHVNWSAVTVREKTYIKDRLPVTKERVTVYVEFVRPVTELDVQAITKTRFGCMKNTEEWQLKVRLWEGSDPIEQIHTRDPTSTSRLTHYRDVGQRSERRHLSPNSSIGTSGRRPLASDPYALCSNQDCTSRWNAFIGKSRKSGHQKVDYKTEIAVQPTAAAVVGVISEPTYGEFATQTVEPKEEENFTECTEIKYCQCCTYPWEAEHEEQDSKEHEEPSLCSPTSSLDLCMILLMGSPDVDRYVNDVQQQEVIELEKRKVPIRRSSRIRTANRQYSCYTMAHLKKDTRKKGRQKVTLEPKLGHYELETIVGEGIDEEGKPKFLCRWTGYDDTHNSWVTDKDMSQARDLVKDWRIQHPADQGSKQRLQKNPCGIQVDPGMVYTHDPKATKEEVDITQGLGTNSSLDTQTPTTFQPQLETIASKILRESAASTTAECPELKILLYLIRNGWKKSPQTDQIEHAQVYDKYSKYANVLKEVNGSIYRVRTETVDSADNEQSDRVRAPGCGRELQWIPPLRKRWSILLQTHAIPDVGHPGAAVMLKRIQDVMWWPDITKHVKTMTETCEICQHSKRRKDPLKEAITVLKYKLPNSELLIDVIEGLPTARNGWKYIIAMTCASSRYTMLVGSARNDSEAVADALAHWITNAPGFPRMIRTGRDTGIVSAAIHELLRRLTISNKTLNAWAPQLLGTQERTHTEVGNHIRIYCANDPEGWHKSLAWAQLVHNTSTHRMTGCTPVMLFKGNPCETLLAASYLPEQTSSIPVKGLAEDSLRFYYQLQKDARQKEFAIHNEHIRRYQADFTKQKKSNESLDIGTSVLIFVPWVPAKLNEGLADRWHGPFKVMQSKGDSYFLQSTRTNHERNQWIKVSKSRVRKLIRLNEPLKVRSVMSDDKYVEPELSPWTATIAGSGELNDGESEVTIAPTAVTSVLFKLDVTPRQEEVDPETSLDIYQIWIQQCSTLLDRYRVHEENEHPKSSRNYVTGDYMTFVGCIKHNLEEAERLIETLSSDLVAPIRETSRSGKTDKDSKLIKPDELSNEEIMNHYVLLWNHGRLKGRTLVDVEGRSTKFNTIVYCTASGESLNHLMKWTSLDSSSLKKATKDMSPDEVSEEFSSKSRRIPTYTWIEMDTPTIPRSYKLLGSWHQYDKVSETWDPTYGAPTQRASQRYTEDNDYGVDYILMCREGQLDDKYPGEPQYIVRWEGKHEDQYSTVARDQFFSELRDTFASNQSIRLGGGYFISKNLNRIDDIHYLQTLAVKESWPNNVVEYIQDRLRDATEVETFVNSIGEMRSAEEREESEYMQDDYWCESEVSGEELDVSLPLQDITYGVHKTELVEESRHKWNEFGKKWSGTVHLCNGESIDVPIEMYYEFMQVLYRKEEKEARKETKVTAKGDIRLAPNRVVPKGVNILFISEKAATMKELHVDKEVMITMSGPQPEVVRGVIVEKLKSLKGFMILIKERDRDAIQQIISFSHNTTGELEPVERDTFGLQLDLLVANPEGKLTDPVMRAHILRHNGNRIVTKLVSHEEVPASTHSGLNNSQSEIVRWASKLKGIGLLFGPPGTGKTHTAAEIIMDWARMNRTNETVGAIFVIASSNVAVDSLMMKFIALLAKEGTNFKIGRLSSRTHSDNIRNQPILRKYDILQQVWEMRRKTQGEDISMEDSNEIADLEDFIGDSSIDLHTKNWIRQQLISTAKTLEIIFTTVALAGSTVLKEIDMVQVLMEEAGATPEYSTVPSFSKNPCTALLIGDFMQLEAVIKCEEVKVVLSQSLFQRLWFTDVPKRQLQIEYRLPGSIIPFFNEIVYNSAHGLQPIMVDPNHTERPVPEGLLINNPIVIVDSSSSGPRRGGSTGDETKVPQRGYYNTTEAETIVEMLEQLIRCVPGTSATCIGISAPYKMQILLIQDLVRKRGCWPPELKIDQILIATADAFQGSEREYMFVSTVRTSYQGLNFAASLRRLNVILSRGSRVTFVVSNSRVFGRSDLRPDHKHKLDTKEGLEALQRLFEWQKGMANVYTLDKWRHIFQGPVNRVMTVKEDRNQTSNEGKDKWEKLYYESWRVSILKKWLSHRVWTSMELIDSDWQKFRVIFRIANNRRMLADTMAYCTQLWIDNLIGTMGGPNPTRKVRDNNTVLTIQNSEVPVKGWPHLSYHRYPRLLIAVLSDEKATDRGLYRKKTVMLGIERGQNEESRAADKGEWYKVSERSKRSMNGLTILTALGLGIINSENRSKKDEVRDTKGPDEESLVNGRMTCIRLEPLRKLWLEYDRKNWDRTSSYSECKRLGLRVQRLQWQMVRYRYQMNRTSKENTIKGDHSFLVVSLMTRLNRNQVHKEFMQHPVRIFEKGEIRVRTGRQLYLKRRWWNVLFRSRWTERSSAMNVSHKKMAWKNHLKHHPWYRFIPLITWLSTWEIGITYLPTSAGKEVWRDWSNPELSENMDIEGNNESWKEWSRKCGSRMKEKGFEFYEDQDIDNWWNHLHTANKREVLKWLLYDRLDHRWHQSTEMMGNYYLGKIPGLRNQEPKTILHSRRRPRQYCASVVEQGGSERYPTQDDLVIPMKEWDRHSREMSMIWSHCHQLWPNQAVRGPGCNSLGKNTSATISKEDALEEQVRLCERIAYHKVGEHRDGRFSNAESIYIRSPFVTQERNLPLFPDHEANMALTKTSEPDGWGYNVHIIRPESSAVRTKQGNTWLNNGLTPSLMGMNPPGFKSVPSQSSEVTYSQPREGACAQSQIRLLLRDRSRSTDVAQGTAVARRYDEMGKLFTEEELRQMGSLNHPTK